MHKTSPHFTNETATAKGHPGQSNEKVAAQPASGSRRAATRTSKRCRTCGYEKPLTSFYRRSDGATGHRADCKACGAAYAKRWRRRGRKTSPRQGERRCQCCEQLCPVSEFSPDQKAHQRRSALCWNCELDGFLPPDRTLRGLNKPDCRIPRDSQLFERRIDLGIAILQATTPPGVCRTAEEIAAYANVAPEVIEEIEREALRKLNARALALLAQAGLKNPPKVAL